MVFTPYNYLLSSELRSGSKVDVKDSVVIFDEGHNIEGFCEDAASGEIRLAISRRFELVSTSSSRTSKRDW